MSCMRARAAPAKSPRCPGLGWRLPGDCCSGSRSWLWPSSVAPRRPTSTCRPRSSMAPSSQDISSRPATEMAMEYLPPQPWMSAPATRAVVAALTAGGADVRFVGGCVRDSILGRAVTDIDIATPDAPTRVIELLEAAGLKAVPTGIEHGTVTAVAFHRPFEITTLRRDVESYGRRAKVSFTDDWTADAARRDFTFNALSCTPEGRLHDPFGGVADLRSQRVRFVGDATARIREDVLRLLRF